MSCGSSDAGPAVKGPWYLHVTRTEHRTVTRHDRAPLISRTTVVCALAAILAVALAGTLSGCGESPSAPSPTATTPAPALASIVSLRISGPASIAPRGRGVSVGQFNAIATWADGSIGDVTTNASWSTANFSVLHLATRPGEMQAEGRGETIVTATAGGISADFLVLVLEAGTFKISGIVTDIATGQGLSGVSMKTTTISALTDRSGHFALYGAVGAIELSASAFGFVVQVHSLVVTAAATDDLDWRQRSLR